MTYQKVSLNKASLQSIFNWTLNEMIENETIDSVEAEILAKYPNRVYLHYLISTGRQEWQQKLRSAYLLGHASGAVTVNEFITPVTVPERHLHLKYFSSKFTLNHQQPYFLLSELASAFDYYAKKINANNSTDLKTTSPYKLETHSYQLNHALIICHWAGKLQLIQNLLNKRFQNKDLIFI